ncbi:TonB-dependent receptor [Sphingomonas sp. MMS24-JH45]
MTNPFNPFGRTLNGGGNGQPADYSAIFRRLVEAGQRTFRQTVDTISLTGTLDGKFQMGDKTWYWDASAVIGRNDARQLFTGNVNTQRLAQALGPVSACTGSCVPLNVFGGVGSITSAMLGYIGFDERSRSNQALNDFTANLSGELFDLPGGPIGIAVGYEHRRYQSGSFTPDPIVQAGFSADIPAQAAAGSFNVDEVYGEIRLPLLRDVPFFSSLELNGAARHSNYSASGSNTTLTGGALWKPVSDLLLRGSYAESVRAPSIGELFGAPTRFDQTLADPCSNIAGSQWQASVTARANCVADGVPADGSYREPQGQLPVITVGNRALQPETARTLLFGGAYSPAWARGGALSALSLEVNYYDIRVRLRDLEHPGWSASACVAFTVYALLCAATTRTRAGFVSAINGVLQNTGTLSTRGIDATFNARTGETGAGVFGLTVIGNYLLRYAETVPATNGFTVIGYEGKERGSPGSGISALQGDRRRSTGRSVRCWLPSPAATSTTCRRSHRSPAPRRSTR